MEKKIGVLLSGCGVFDGSEIHEAVLTLLALDQKNVEIICIAPDADQMHVINHLTQEQLDERRNVLVESARIARGDIKDLKEVQASDFDALVIPGGFGAAKNLSDFAVSGKDAVVHPEVQRILQEMISSGKPIGAMCIAPATLTKAISGNNPEVTIGHDQSTAFAIETMGGRHIPCDTDMIHIDQKNKIVTTPAYMTGTRIKDVNIGIEMLIEKVISLS